MAAVIGLPDAARGEVVAAFVTLRTNAGREGIEARLIDRVKTRISPHVAPRSVTIVDALPMTATGKIMRRALRETP
jgi:acetyl-CoA synthetase